MPCPRLLALYAFLRQMGACDRAAFVLDPEYQFSDVEVSEALSLLNVDCVTWDAILSMWVRVPDDKSREAALAVLELYMWDWYSYRAQESARQQIWCLYYEQPPCAERLPF